MKIVVIDGQGGGIGRQLIAAIRKEALASELIAVGTNAAATAAMLKAGADAGATGENAVIVNCRTADVIVGPIGVSIADSLMGEVSPAMAVAVGQSPAVKVLLPVNQCNHLVAGVQDFTVSRLVQEAVQLIQNQCRR